MSEKDGGPALTDWYPAHVKPVRDGVYERDVSGISAGNFSYWANGLWHGWSIWEDAAEANYLKGYVSSLQNRPWRGLAERAK